MSIITRIAAVLGLCVLTPIFLSAGPPPSDGVDRTIQHEGRTREYRLYVPENLDRSRPAPLVFALHGGGGNAVREEGRTDYDALAERDGWIVVYPNGIDGHWNDLRGYQEFVSHRENVDDVGFLAALIDEMQEEFKIDQKRVFVTGGSNGGLMSHSVAARLADRVAAIAPIVGSMARPVYQTFQPSQPVSVMMINYRGDPLVKWDGGEGGRSNFVSMPETIERWKQVNRCTDEETKLGKALAGETADLDVLHTIWNRCSTGVNMELYVVEADRHGHPTAVLDKASGRRVYQVIWDFFQRSGRK